MRLSIILSLVCSNIAVGFLLAPPPSHGLKATPISSRNSPLSTRIIPFPSQTSLHTHNDRFSSFKIPSRQSSLIQHASAAASSLPPTSTSIKNTHHSRIKRLLLGATALLLVTAIASRISLLSLSSTSTRPTLATALAPIARLQDAIEPLSSGPLAPLGTVLSWALDFIEVGIDATKFILSIVFWPILTLLRFVLRLLSPVLAPLTHPISTAQDLIQTFKSGRIIDILLEGLQPIITGFFEGCNVIKAYGESLLSIVLTFGSIIHRQFFNTLAAFFNVNTLQTLDTMDPRRHIPAAPRFVAANGIKIKAGNFGLKQMYGRRWTVHAGKWDWAIPFWERVAMESQLVRNRNSFSKSAVKARFGFPEIIRGPSPLLGGTLLFFAAMYAIYRAHVTSSIWIRQLQKETYGKNLWNPVTRLEEEEEEGGDEGEGGSKRKEP